jgi:hypothetical protein
MGWPRNGGRGSNFWSEMGKPNMKVERLPSFLAMFLMFIDYQTSPECIEETTEKPQEIQMDYINFMKLGYHPRNQGNLPTRTGEHI